MGDPVIDRWCRNLVRAFLAAALLSLPLHANGAAEDAERKAFMVTDYRYEPPAGLTGNPDIGLSLCGTRCNALSGDFASYLKPGGWRMIKISGGIEIKVELNNPFLAGQCVCVGDEYKIDRYDQAVYLDRAGPGTALSNNVNDN